MKHLKYLTESKIDYTKELSFLYKDIFEKVFEQNKGLYKELDYIEDLLLEIFDQIGEYPIQELKIYFFEHSAKSLKDFSLRIYDLDLGDDYEDDYNYIINKISEDMDVYIFVLYMFPTYVKLNKDKYDIDIVNRKLTLIDFEPNYFIPVFEDDDRNGIGYYKKIKFKYIPEYLSNFPEHLREDIKKFVLDNKLSNTGIDDLNKIIKKSSTNN